MAIERDTSGERQARLELLVEQYRDSQKRRTLKRAVALWRRVDAQRTPAVDPPIDKMN
jgi:hypothetical protein